MHELRVVVCVKVVPKPEEIRVDTDTHLLIRQNVRSEINPPDMNAVEMALALKDRHKGKVYILSMGPPDAMNQLGSALAMGADHVYLLSDRAFSGADTLATTYTLARGIQKLGGVDVVLCGEESSDGATGQVPQGLAEWLDFPQLTLVTELSLDLQSRTARGRRAIKGGYEILEVPLPCVVSVKTACNEPRFMDLRLKRTAHSENWSTTWNAADVGAEPEYIGKAGSPTWVSGLASAAARNRKQERICGTQDEVTENLAQLIRKILNR
jgi:electron transfer flavoprotein beta subunit